MSIHYKPSYFTLRCVTSYLKVECLSMVGIDGLEYDERRIPPPMTISVFGIEDAAPTHLSTGVTERRDEKNASDFESFIACMCGLCLSSINERASELAT